MKENEVDHNKPWNKERKTTKAIDQMLCKDCNRTKSDI